MRGNLSVTMKTRSVDQKPIFRINPRNRLLFIMIVNTHIMKIIFL